MVQLDLTLEVCSYCAQFHFIAEFHYFAVTPLYSIRGLGNVKERPGIRLPGTAKNKNALHLHHKRCCLQILLCLKSCKCAVTIVF